MKPLLEPSITQFAVWVIRPQCVDRRRAEFYKHNIVGLVQDCSISSALALEILQSCTKTSTYTFIF